MAPRKSYLCLCVLSLRLCVKLVLIFRHARIDFIRPANNPALEIYQFSLKPGTLKRVDRACAASTHLAVHDRLAVRIDLVHAIQHLRQRDVN